jgi:hypothetical protein
MKLHYSCDANVLDLAADKLNTSVADANNVTNFSSPHCSDLGKWLHQKAAEMATGQRNAMIEWRNRVIDQ